MREPHPDADALLDLALGHVDEPGRSRLVDHLRGCATCQAEYDDLAAAVELALPAAPAMEPPLGFEQRVLEAIGLPGPPGRRRQTSDSSAKPQGMRGGRSPTNRKVGRAWQLVAAAVLGVAVGVGGSLALAGSEAPETPGAALVTADGSSVGTASHAVLDERRVIVVSIVEGPTGRHYVCRVRMADGSVVDVADWTLGPGGGAWVVRPPAAGEVTELMLVTDTGDTWSTARF